MGEISLLYFTGKASNWPLLRLDVGRAHACAILTTSAFRFSLQAGARSFGTPSPPSSSQERSLPRRRLRRFPLLLVALELVAKLSWVSTHFSLSFVFA